MKTIFGRRIILTELDPIPRAFRAAPGVFAINKREREALDANDRKVIKELMDICKAEDAAEVRLIGIYSRLAGTDRNPRRKR
jgi:hypothetical protein